MLTLSNIFHMKFFLFNYLCFFMLFYELGDSLSLPFPAIWLTPSAFVFIPTGRLQFAAMVLFFFCCHLTPETVTHRGAWSYNLVLILPCKMSLLITSSINIEEDAGFDI